MKWLWTLLLLLGGVWGCADDAYSKTYIPPPEKGGPIRPEPSTIVLLVVGAASYGVYRLVRKKRDHE